MIFKSMTEANVHDCEALNALLPSNDKSNIDISQVTGDGAYDTHDCYEAAIKVGARLCFPPRAKAVKNKPTDEAWRLRNQAVGGVRDKGLKQWKKKNNYHRHSLSETTFSRLKKILGTNAASRVFKNQATELVLCCHMLNKMNQLGLPDSVKI